MTPIYFVHKLLFGHYWLTTYNGNISLIMFIALSIKTTTHQQQKTKHKQIKSHANNCYCLLMEYLQSFMDKFRQLEVLSAPDY